MGLPLEVQGLSVRAPRGRTLVALESLALSSGASLGISGPSGAGKSTLLYALAGLMERCGGSVRWGETELLSLRAAQRARFRAAYVGMVFQDFLLFDELSALGNAAIAAGFAPKADRAALRGRAAKELARLGLTQPDRSVTSYSGGERQRVAIARALSGDPAILLADEPTASLDRAAADRVIDDLVAAAKDGGTTLICVSHDAALLSRMDRILRLENGAEVPDRKDTAA